MVSRSGQVRTSLVFPVVVVVVVGKKVLGKLTRQLEMPHRSIVLVLDLDQSDVSSQPAQGCSSVCLSLPGRLQ